MKFGFLFDIFLSFLEITIRFLKIL